MPRQNVDVTSLLPAATDPKSKIDDVTTSASNSARTTASADSSVSAFDQSPTSINVLEGTVDDICRELGMTYEELLDALRQSGHGVVLDTSQALPENFDAHVLAGFELTCAIQMMDEGFRAAVCLHEAAHAEYMERLGDTYIRFMPPYVLYKPDGELTCCDAAVTNDMSEEDDFAQMNADALGYTKSILAAGIVESVLTEQQHDGTSIDNEELEAMFDKIGTAHVERERILKQARAEVLKDLRSPAFRKALWKRAKFYQRILEHAIYANREPVRVQEAA